MTMYVEFPVDTRAYFYDYVCKQQATRPALVANLHGIYVILREAKKCDDFFIISADYRFLARAISQHLSIPFRCGFKEDPVPVPWCPIYPWVASHPAKISAQLGTPTIRESTRRYKTREAIYYPAISLSGTRRYGNISPGYA